MFSSPTFVDTELPAYIVSELSNYFKSENPLVTIEQGDRVKMQARQTFS